MRYLNSNSSNIRSNKNIYIRMAGQNSSESIRYTLMNELESKSNLNRNRVGTTNIQSNRQNSSLYEILEPVLSINFERNNFLNRESLNNIADDGLDPYFHRRSEKNTPKFEAQTTPSNLEMQSALLLANNEIFRKASSAELEGLSASSSAASSANASASSSAPASTTMAPDYYASLFGVPLFSKDKLGASGADVSVGPSCNKLRSLALPEQAFELFFHYLGQHRTAFLKEIVSHPLFFKAKKDNTLLAQIKSRSATQSSQPEPSRVTAKEQNSKAFNQYNHITNDKNSEFSSIFAAQCASSFDINSLLIGISYLLKASVRDKRSGMTYPEIFSSNIS